ncbi:MAG: ribbon-helix-helix protein, CopG family [Longimicrobiales bacterium]
MADDVKENVNFRLAKQDKRTLTELAAAQDKAVSELIREVIEAYIAQQERAAWEEEARRASRALAREASDPRSAESEHLRMLEANLNEFAKEWVWEDEE